MNDCNTCSVRWLARCLNDSQPMYVRGLPVCPVCGSVSTGMQGAMPGCVANTLYTEFMCGSRFIVFYKHNIDLESEPAIISTVTVTDVCRDTAMKEDII